MDQYKTETGRREDLEALETNPVIGYIGSQILPPVNTAEKTGTFYYQTLTGDDTAQTGRTAGVAPTIELLGSNNTTYTATEIIERYGMVLAEVKQSGGLEVSDKICATAAKRSVQRAMEELIADAVLLQASSTVDDIESSLIAACNVGLNSIRRYPGRTAFVCSYTIFNRIMRYTEITGRFGLSSASISGVDAIDIIARRPAALKMLLAGILGVDEVLVGDDQQWYTSDASKQTRAALVKLPDPDQFSHKMDPVFGKSFMYLPDGSQPYVIESFYNTDTRVNVYDASVWQNLVILNAGANYILTGIDEANAVTTSTTSTA